jgi:hypothetical protein
MKTSICGFASLTAFNNYAADYTIASRLPLTQLRRVRQLPSPRNYSQQDRLYRLYQARSPYSRQVYSHQYAATRYSGRASTLQSWIPTK